MDYEKLNEVPHCVRNDSLKDFFKILSRRRPQKNKG